MGYFGTMLRLLCVMSVIWIASAATRVRIDMSLSQYGRFISQNSNAGYFPARTCGYNVNGRVYYAAVMNKRNGEGWTIRYNVNAAGLRSAFNLMVLQRRYRIASLSGFEQNGQHHFTVVFHSQRNPVTVKVRWAQTVAEWGRNLTGFLAHQYAPVYQDGYTVKGVPYINTVYQKVVFPTAWRIGMDQKEYDGVNRDYQPMGYRVLSVSGYDNGKITAVWQRNNGPAQLAEVEVARPRNKAGYMITHICGYQNSQGRKRYAVVWTKTN